MRHAQHRPRRDHEQEGTPPMATARAAQLADVLAQLADLLAADPAPAPPPEPTTPPQRVLLTVEEAAQQLGIGKTKAYEFVRTGELRSVRIGRLRRIHVDSIAEFAARLIATESGS